MSVWCVVGGLLVASAVQAAKTNYVNQLGTNDIPPFTNWDLATSNLQAAINDTVANDTVLVTNGTYLIASEIAIANAIIVKSVWGANSTLVARAASGTNAPQHRIFNITAAATLDGFTVRNGYLPAGNKGGGILMSAGTVQNCVIYTNVIANAWNSLGAGVCMSGSSLLQFCSVVSNTSVETAAGAGVSASGNALLISNTVSYNNGDGAVFATQPTAKFCVFENNAGSGVRGYGIMLTNCVIRFNKGSKGGGLFLTNGNKIYDCTIVSNTATVMGGGLYSDAYYDRCDIRRCVISGNSHATYPGVYIRGWYNTDTPRPSTTFENCRITDNIGVNSVYSQEGGQPVKFQNCTIASTGSYGFNIPSTTYFSPQFTNTIVYGHGTNIYSADSAVLAAILTNSLRFCCSPQLTEPGLNNVAADPAFVAPVSWNYHLKRFSPCARTGSTNVLSLYKSDLEQVPFGKTVNMGCYETLTPYAGGTVVTVR